MEKKNGSWTIKETRKIFGNDFFEVYEDDVIRPDGKDGKYATISFMPGVTVLPIDGEGRIYLTRQFRYAIGREELEAAAGAIEGESPAEAAKREAREELGIEADEWIELGSTRAVTSITNSTSHLFIAKGLKFTEPEPEGTEEIERVTLSLDEAAAMVDRGEITHGDTCLLILQALRKQ